MKAQTKEQYQAGWNNHLDLLHSVCFDMINLPECKELEKLIIRAKELVVVASGSVEYEEVS
jgi:hypothetical protein